MQNLKGWRTVGFNVLAAGFTVLQGTDFSTLLSPKYMWLTGLITAGINIGLRAVTDTPIGKANAPIATPAKP
jgi:hypothetical protein